MRPIIIVFALMLALGGRAFGEDLSSPSPPPSNPTSKVAVKKNAASLLAEAKRLATAGKPRQAFDVGRQALIASRSTANLSPTTRDSVVFLKTLLLGLRLFPENIQQIGDLQNGLPKPLVVTVTQGPHQTPVVMWPLAFSFGDTGRVFDGNILTDAQGKVAEAVRKFDKPGQSILLNANSDDQVLLAGLPPSDPVRAELAEVIRAQAVGFNVRVSGVESNETTQIVTTGRWSNVDLVKIQAALGGLGYTVRSDAIAKEGDWESQLAPGIQWLVLLDNDIQQRNYMSGMNLVVLQASVVVKNRNGATSSDPAHTFVCEAKGGGGSEMAAMNAAIRNAAEKIAKQIETTFPKLQP
jgi:hypothetical protein